SRSSSRTWTAPPARPTAIRGGSAYHGHLGCACYHPLFLFNPFGDLERVLPRRGNHAGAKFWRRVLLPVLARYQDLDIPKSFRGGAAFAGPKLLRSLGQEAFRCASRVKPNAVRERKVAPVLQRPVGRPSREPEVSTPAPAPRRSPGVRPPGGGPGG